MGSRPVVINDDIKINFYRKGTANIIINNKPAGKWAVMPKGARSGYSSFTLTGKMPQLMTNPTIDSLFGTKGYSYKLLQTCDKNALLGFYYYEVNIPQRISAFIKISWKGTGSNAVISLDVYNSFNKQHADLDCR